MGLITFPRTHESPYRERLTKDISTKIKWIWNRSSNPKSFILIGFILSQIVQAFCSLIGCILPLFINYGIIVLFVILWVALGINRKRYLVDQSTDYLVDPLKEVNSKMIDITIQKIVYANGRERYAAKYLRAHGDLVCEFGDTEKEAVDELKKKLYKEIEYTIQIPEIG